MATLIPALGAAAAPAAGAAAAPAAAGFAGLGTTAAAAAPYAAGVAAPAVAAAAPAAASGFAGLGAAAPAAAYAAGTAAPTVGIASPTVAPVAAPAATGFGAAVAPINAAYNTPAFNNNLGVSYGQLANLARSQGNASDFAPFAGQINQARQTRSAQLQGLPEEQAQPDTFGNMLNFFRTIGSR